MSSVHWTQKKPKPPTIAQKARGNPELTDMAINLYLKDIDRMLKEGKKDSPLWRFTVSELDKLGYDRDYIAGYDDGEPPRSWDRLAEYEK